MHSTLSTHMAASWDASLAFHGHNCPGLALGCRVATDALARMGMDGPSQDEELVCVAETDSCAVDAIQAITGCTLGKGNLLLRIRGKHAFTFYHRDSTGSFRILWRASQKHDMPRPERALYYLSAPASALYTISEARHPLPEKALISASLICALCGELTAESHIRLRDGQPQCMDCHVTASRVLR